MFQVYKTILKPNLEKVQNLKDLHLGTKQEPMWVKKIRIVLPQKDNNDGRALAHYAAYYGKKREIEFLLKLNADFSAADNNKNPAWSYLIWYAKNPKELEQAVKLLIANDYNIWQQNYKKYLNNKITPKNKLAKKKISTLIEQYKEKTYTNFCLVLKKISDKVNDKQKLRAAYDDFKKELKQFGPRIKILNLKSILTKKITTLANKKADLRKLKIKNIDTYNKILNLENNIKTLEQLQSVCKLLISLFLYKNDLFSERIRKNMIKSWYEENGFYLQLEVKNVDNGIFLPIDTNDANKKNYLHYIIDHNKIEHLKFLIENKFILKDPQAALSYIKLAFAKHRILMMCFLFGYMVPIGLDKKLLNCLEDADKLKPYLAILINDKNLVAKYIADNRYQRKDKNLDIILKFIKENYGGVSNDVVKLLQAFMCSVKIIPLRTCKERVYGNPIKVEFLLNSRKDKTPEIIFFEKKPYQKKEPPLKKVSWFENFNQFDPKRINQLISITKSTAIEKYYQKNKKIIPKIAFIVNIYLNQLGYDARIFGGLPRNYALNIKANDVDVVTNAPFEIVTELVKYFGGYLRPGKHPHYQFTVWENSTPVKVDINRIDNKGSTDAFVYNSLDEYISVNHDFSFNSLQLKFDEHSNVYSFNFIGVIIEARTDNAIILDHSLVYRGVMFYLKCRINSVTVSFEKNTLEQIKNTIPNLFMEDISLSPARICSFLKKMFGNSNADKYLKLLFECPYTEFANILPFHVILNFKYKNLNNIYNNIKKINKLPYNTDKKLGKIFAELLWPYVKIHMHHKDIRELIKPVKEYMFYTYGNNEIFKTAVNTLYFKRCGFKRCGVKVNAPRPNYHQSQY